jgi:hypothetical protein
MLTNKSFSELEQLIEQAAQKAVEYYANRKPYAQEYLDTKQAAEFLGLSTQTLEIWRVYGNGPRYTKLSQKVRYNINDLREFMNSKVRVNTTTVGGQNDN